MTAADIEALARLADCTHVDLTGDRAKALERLTTFAALVKGSSAPSAEPEGWKLVPLFPTMAMLDAASHKFQTAKASVIGFNARELAYKAMLDAAPLPLAAATQGAPTPAQPRFDKTYCSQCGGEFGPGDQGYSHCKDHADSKWPAVVGERFIQAWINLKEMPGGMMQANQPPYRFGPIPATTSCRITTSPSEAEMWRAQGADVLAIYTAAGIQPTPEQAKPTGREPELLQDCDRKLSRALASKPDSRMHAREAAAVIQGDGKREAAQGEPEPCRPDILERLTHPALERDDLTLDECLSFLAKGWRETHGRDERTLVLQILSLLASQLAAGAQGEDGKDGVALLNTDQQEEPR